MTESYAAALRDKRELERKLHNFSRDGRRNASRIKQEKFTLIHGLHDVRSKTKNLHETIDFIRKALRDQKSCTEEELSRLAARRRAMTQREAERERQLLVKLELADLKAAHIGGVAAGDDDSDAAADDRALHAVQMAAAGLEVKAGPSQKAVPPQPPKAKAKPTGKSPPRNASATDDYGSDGGGDGGGGDVGSVEQQQQQRKKQRDDDRKLLPDNLPDLIRFYVMYPPEHKVALKKPKKTDFTRARLARFKEDQANALSNGTKTRLRRVDFHCKAIESVYLDDEPVEHWSRKLARASRAAAL